MVCSTSIRWHLARGLGALVSIAAALRFGADYPVVAIVGIVSAIVLLRGCPMCWLFGLFNRLHDNKDTAR